MPLRHVFHDEMDAMSDQLVAMSVLVGSAISRATTALLQADLQLAEDIIAADEEIDRMQGDLDERTVLLLAQQQPVATDLRVIVSTLRMSATIERMGDLARHVAKVARLRYPASAVPTDLHPVFREMGDVAERIAQKMANLLVSRDLTVAREIESIDDDLDRLHRQLFTRMLSPEWGGAVECTIDVTLLSRYYERFGDHGVSVARRMGFIVTGEWPGTRTSDPSPLPSARA